MHQAVQSPLPLDLLFTAQGESIEPLVRTNVAKDRLHHTHSMAVDLFALRTVHTVLHPVRVGRLAFVIQNKRDLSALTFAVVG